MKKIVLQIIIATSLFFATWLVLTQIDWIRLFKVQEITDNTEEKLGDLFWEEFQRSEVEFLDPLVLNAVDSIVTRVCTSNEIDRDFIKVHVLVNEEINAFALPNGHLVIYTGLIKNADNQEELTGVICHELAHIQLNHVMKKLMKEIGLSVLISISTGNGSVAIIKEIAKLLSSSAFDRALEAEADIKAVDYMINANINPEPFADFLFKLSHTQSDAAQYLTWISTHPESKERAMYVLDYCKDKKTTFTPTLTLDTWDKLKGKIAEQMPQQPE